MLVTTNLVAATVKNHRFSRSYINQGHEPHRRLPTIGPIGGAFKGASRGGPIRE
jgi:hypothetical protein